MSSPRDKTSPRAAPKDNIDRMIDILNDLRERLDVNGPTGAVGSGMLEKYDYFCRVSDRGRDCTYGIKSKKLFLLNDLEDVKKLVEQFVKTIRTLPGNENYGR